MEGVADLGVGAGVTSAVRDEPSLSRANSSPPGILTTGRTQATSATQLLCIIVYAFNGLQNVVQTTDWHNFCRVTFSLHALLFARKFVLHSLE